MAWAEKLPSGKYRGVYRDSAGKRRSAGTFTHKPEAERKAGAKEDDSRKVGWRAPERAATAWGDWCEQWWPTRTVEPGHLSRGARVRDNYLQPRWGDVPLGDITRHDIREWAARLAAPRPDGTRLSGSTVQRIVHLLSASLTAAVDAEILPANPAARLKLPKGQQAPERYLTGEEYDAIRAELDGDYALIADGLVGTGMRWGELAGLHWHRVDLTRGLVRVVETWDDEGELLKAYPKGRKVRDVPLPGWLTEQLTAPVHANAACGLPHAQGKCRHPLVFTAPHGGVLDRSNFRHKWDAAVARAGVGHVRVHDLRHTYASWLLQDGASLEEVGMLLGHVSAETTRKYAHLVEHASRDAVRAGLERRRGANRGAPGHPT